jgi:hypothetical protein
MTNCTQNWPSYLKIIYFSKIPLQYCNKNLVLQKAKMSSFVEIDLHLIENSTSIIRVAELLLL